MRKAADRPRAPVVLSEGGFVPWRQKRSSQGGPYRPAGRRTAPWESGVQPRSVALGSRDPGGDRDSKPRPKRHIIRWTLRYLPDESSITSCRNAPQTLSGDNGLCLTAAQGGKEPALYLLLRLDASDSRSHPPTPSKNKFGQVLAPLRETPL